MWKAVLVLFALTMAIEASPFAEKDVNVTSLSTSLQFLAKTTELSYFGNGCCLFDRWTIAYYRGDLTIQQCLDECNNDPSCAAVDLSQPNGEGWNAKYICHTLPGTLENLHAACDLRTCLCKDRKDQHCFAKKKPTSCRDDPRCQNMIEYHKQKNDGTDFCRRTFSGIIGDLSRFIGIGWVAKQKCPKHCNAC